VHHLDGKSTPLSCHVDGNHSPHTSFYPGIAHLFNPTHIVSLKDKIRPPPEPPQGGTKACAACCADSVITAAHLTVGTSPYGYLKQHQAAGKFTGAFCDICANPVCHKWAIAEIVRKSANPLAGCWSDHLRGWYPSGRADGNCTFGHELTDISKRKKPLPPMKNCMLKW
jgi:hypothetical protein